MFTKNKKWEIERLIDECVPARAKVGSVIEQEYKTNTQYFAQVKHFDFTPSESEVFFDEDRVGYKGLRVQQVLFDKAGKAIFLVDNHDKALMAFYETYEQNKETLKVIHIDAHRDNAIFLHNIPSEISQKSVLNVLSKTKVSDYLDVGKKLGLISEVIQVTQSFEFEDFVIPTKDFVLNLDIDIFAADGEAVPLEKRIEVLCKVWSAASAVVIATSPGFIDQQDAKFIIEKLVEKLVQ